MYVIVGFHKILAQHLPEYLENVKTHAANSQAEPGCVSYEVFRDEGDPTVFCLREVFEDEPAFHAHQAAPHYKWWMDLSRGWRDGPPLSRNVMRYVAPESEPQA